MILKTQNYRAYLAEELARRVRDNSRYSQRAFAKHLGMSPGELSEILNQKRCLSLKSVLRIAEALSLNQTETRHLSLLVQQEHTKALGKESLLKERAALLEELPPHEKFSEEHFAIVSDWYHMAILNLAETEDFSWSEKSIAKRIGISQTEVHLALRRLQKTGLIIPVKPRSYRVKANYLEILTNTPSQAIKQFHRQMLALAIRSLETQRMSEREISGITFSVDPTNLPAMKKDISDFLDEMLAKYSRGKKRKSVYHLEAALFQLTQGEIHA